ncbi:MAG: sigma-54 dependent transcriptional regulator, partial [Acidobacteriia bacterium]|nr:sigma-54 dependent transcriptional regulator [Terriglobia bacterium]
DLRLLTTVGEITSLALNEARRTEGPVSENRRLRTELTARHRMVGESPAMRRVYDSISRIAPLDSTVLITGESGAGKELAARALHENSGRRDRPFVAINCADLTDTLLETELFGHERGAFTGAVAQKKGKLEAAEGGTVFLDEVGELAGPIQAKLLRVLQEREFERVGGVRPIKLDVRLVAATNGDLAEAVRHQRFRADLFFRLNVISIAIPPLRDRREDIPLLANYFRVLHSERVKRRVTGISAQTHAKLLAYVWPGNVRELGSAIESAVALGSTELILPEDLPEAVLQAPTAEPSSHFNRALIETKKRLIEEAYQQAGGDYVRAARLLGLHPNSLLRLVRTLDLKGAVLH